MFRGELRLSGRRRVLTNRVRDGMRIVNAQLEVLNRAVSAHLALREVDLDCLDLIQRHESIGPSRLASAAGIHPATLTGVLDRLQRGGLIVRERDPHAVDRRSVTVRIRPDRAGEIYRLYSGMLTRMDGICSRYSAAELELLVDFLDRVAAAGSEATVELAPPGPPQRSSGPPE